MPAISDDVLSSPSGLRELRCEPLDPPVDAHVIDLDAPFRQELLDVSVGKPEPEVPPDRQGDDLEREAVPGEGRARRWSDRRMPACSHRASLPDADPGGQRNSAGGTIVRRRDVLGGLIHEYAWAA